MNFQHLQGGSTKAECSDKREAADVEPLSADEFLAFFWGLHLFGTDFIAVKRLVGTRKVRMRSNDSVRCDSAISLDTARHVGYDLR